MGRVGRAIVEKFPMYMEGFFFFLIIQKVCLWLHVKITQNNSLWHYFLGSENFQFFFLLSCRFATFSALFLLEVPLNLWRVCINVNHSLRGYPVSPTHRQPHLQTHRLTLSSHSLSQSQQIYILGKGFTILHSGFIYFWSVG